MNETTENEDKVLRTWLTTDSPDYMQLIVSSIAELKIPMERFEEITLANVDIETPKKNPDDIRAFFANRPRLTLR